MSKKVFDFKEQLAVGDKGEELFLAKHPDLTRLDGRNGDFIGFSKRKIELKTDSRTTRDTVNFFIERFSSMEKQSPGGPWRSMVDEVYYFVYLFADSYIYWLETAALVEHLDAHLADYKSRTVYNKGWTALGYLVPRASLEHLIVKKEKLDEKKV